MSQLFPTSGKPKTGGPDRRGDRRRDWVMLHLQPALQIPADLEIEDEPLRRSVQAENTELDTDEVAACPCGTKWVTVSGTITGWEIITQKDKLASSHSFHSL
jgi:hypothetical protein